MGLVSHRSASFLILKFSRVNVFKFPRVRASFTDVKNDDECFKESPIDCARLQKRRWAKTVLMWLGEISRAEGNWFKPHSEEQEFFAFPVVLVSLPQNVLLWVKIGLKPRFEALITQPTKISPAALREGGVKSVYRLAHFYQGEILSAVIN